MRQIRLKVEYPEHDKVVLTNSKGDTYTSNEEDLMDFLHDESPPVEAAGVQELIDKNKLIVWLNGLKDSNQSEQVKDFYEILIADIERFYKSFAPSAFPQQDSGYWKQRCEAAEGAIGLILKEPYGCPMCDSGKLRNPLKQHWDDCGFHKAELLLYALKQQKGE